MDKEELQGAGAMFALASRLVYQEPSADEIRSYAEQDLFAGAPFGGDDPSVARGLELMRDWCAKAAASDDFDDCVADAKRDQFQLFVGAGEPKAASWAGYYLSASSQILSAETLPVRRLYREFGLQMENLNREPDDNLGIMMGFIAHLIGLETDEETCADMRERAVAAQKELIAGHILPWIAVWHYSTLKHARTDFFSGVGELVFGLIRAYAKRFGCTYNEEKAAFVFEG